MTYLALEFSSLQRSVAVLRIGSAGALVTESEAIESGVTATRALGLSEEALKQAQVEREQVECVVVGLGPGSYTGVRAAIAVAQGWQLARTVKVLGVSTAEVLAAQAHDSGVRGRVKVVIDAHRNEFYLAEYEIDDGGYHEVAGLQLLTLQQAQSLPPPVKLIGPEATKWFPLASNLYPSASMLARLARKRTDYISAERLEPIYLRETTFVKAPAPRVIPN